jgi:ribonuclease HI
MAKKNKFFVVWDGYEPGIYKTWDECKQQTHGYPEAKFKAFENLADAQEAFLSPYWDFIGKNKKPETGNAELRAKVGEPIADSISVDAACSGNPGKMEYQGVYTKTKEKIFLQGPFENATNNIGEFLALVHALALLKQKNSDLPIYSDSLTAIGWVKKKKTKTLLEKSDNNKIVFELIERAEKWLANNTYTTQILKWETEAWGEIPADFGRK